MLDVPELRPGMRNGIAEGRFERPEIEIGRKVFRPGDRIIEMGTGLGIVGAIMAQNCQIEAMLSFEGNYRLIAAIRALYERNNLSSIIEVRNALLFSAPNPPETVPFYIRDNFLGSGLASANPRTETYHVAVEPWDKVKAAFRPNALLLDIEGAELEFFRHADLSGIERIVFEIHRKVYQRAGIHEIRDVLNAQGFEQIYHDSGVKAFVRT